MESHFANPQFYRHVDGGLYRAYTQALHTEDMGAHMVYEHVWPFPVTPCVRPLKAFQARFALVSDEEAHALMAGDRVAAQEAIRAAKKSRQAQEGKVGKSSSLHLRTGQAAEDEFYRLARGSAPEGCWVTLQMKSELGHNPLSATTEELAAMTPERLLRYELIIMETACVGQSNTWRYTYDPENMAGALEDYL